MDRNEEKVSKDTHDSLHKPEKERLLSFEDLKEEKGHLYRQEWN